MKDIQRTIHYSRNKQLVENLIPFVDDSMKLIEPFCGEKYLMEVFPNNEWEYYDILSKEEEHQRDTLKNPPEYKGKWLITNPPYLAKNKATDKDIFKKYPDVDDLYKIAIETSLDCEGGILIIPINFLADEKSEKIRKKFLSKFEILKLNIFTEQMFDYTTYNVCSFFFKKKSEQKDTMVVPTIIHPEGKECTLNLAECYGWRIGGKTLTEIAKVDNIFSRLTKANPNPKGFITHINAVCIDRTDEPLHLYYDEPFYGKASDRNICSLVSDIDFSEEEEKAIIEEANRLITQYREESYNICLTNYRDRNRKRIGFKEVYAFASLAYKNLKEKNNL